MKESSLQSRLEACLGRLVAMPTVSNDVGICAVAINGFATELAALGMHVTPGGESHPWLVATTQKTKHPKVMLAVHIDVVPPSSDDQFTMRAKGNKLFGRGVFDMKLALACYLELTKELNEAGTLHNYDFGILITADEEIGGMHGVGEAVRDGWRADIVLLPDSGENWQTEAKSKGFAWYTLRAEGRSTHASRPWEGDNALLKILPALHEITQKYPNDDKLGVVVSPTSLNAGQAHNQLPGSAELKLDTRALTEHEMHEVKAFLFDLSKRHGLTITHDVDSRPVSLDQENPLVQQAIAEVVAITGKPAEFSYSLAGSDARFFGDVGVPCFVVEPHGGDRHGPNEWIQRDDLAKFYEFIANFTKKVAKYKV